MAKKYQPSGYQIITINRPDVEGGTPVALSYDELTEDEKILYDMLVVAETEPIKPILIFANVGSSVFQQFGVYIDKFLYVGDISGQECSLVSFNIDNSNKLQIAYTEV